MSSLKSVICGLVAIVASSTGFAAADPSVNTVVNPVLGNEQVTLSRTGTSKQNLPLDTFAAYQATITNGATNTLNRVFLTGTATNVGGTDTVTFDSSIPAGICSGVGNKVTCSLPSLSPGTASQPLIMVFKAPTNGSQIRFDWRAGGSEGNGGGNGCCSQTGSVTTSLIDPTSDPEFKTTAKTFVKNAGNKVVFTGNEAITTSTDGWSTIVEIPPFTSTPLGAYTLATITEKLQGAPYAGGSCQPYSVGLGCFQSELTIPGSFASLKITIRWDKSFFNLGSTRPQDVKLYYQHDLTAPLNPVQVNLCSVDLANGAATAPSSTKPCMTQPPRVLKNQDTPIKDLVGDLEFKVEALDNGRFSN